MNIQKRLTKKLKKNSGRGMGGKVSTRHQGGGAAQRIRTIDWERKKFDMPATVEAIEYDPIRTARIALIKYLDGERRYILSPEGLKIGQSVVSGKEAEAKLGNCTALRNIPVGMPIHNLELTPGKGSQIVRGAGTQAVILAREGDFANVRLPSGETRKIILDCFATIGQVGNLDWKNKVWGKAGIMRHRGIRPTVRGTAQNPNSHPHGGGEGRSGEGMDTPKTPWGKPARGKKTRNRTKYSNYLMIKRIS
ncbi:50S ribosomal protein L2 [Candidatus Shapirobacteria bacterium CG08_land_8_20_14_0_20_39_18]|uniref:Large ribosomal subunit protein uL2 n=1 Tax=Candidatus Shapirobacteria bacterium CG08_land_8_20_14_0_20_39_18 TaxID=1974883 RepID=A0A2M6XC65_9BACT|nr:MAG: 50S ribosomal protein L2 [Candidatus Shapirobacteria bacterium CG08_land_8_20_14_0_20_39_18]PIY66405.1 MAG: 50S ribosomal protein L2 [Candidatus Shapirobacteria bacterium CG_4_10_14_0_8_um_filter_39_15]PJE68429.1 MAG: 50S ribosomal protein L2 [Candidatus Shapirobacteria bacterium CG10_big_fil_rev_8_21_14_0_10_38_8]